MVEESFKQKVLTPIFIYLMKDIKVEESFKQKVLTPFRYLFLQLNNMKKNLVATKLHHIVVGILLELMAAS